MSHELRTPLTGVLAMAEALQTQTHGALNEHQLRLLRRIEESGRHLLEVINDILDLSKLEAGKLELSTGNVDADQIGRACLQIVAGPATAKHQNLRLELRPSPISLCADARRLKQMLINLLSNAIKFTPDGGEIGLSIEARVDQGTVSFTVSDNGIGIGAEELPKLFRPFVQLDSSLTRRHAGTGLGLVLVKRMAELHGGAVAVASTPGKGSQFMITLPQQPLPGQTKVSATD
jgi:signal transduction histidine kinase